MTYTDEITAQPGWREITHEDVTQGMRVRAVTTRGDRIITYEGTADYWCRGDWFTHGDQRLPID